MAHLNYRLIWNVGMSPLGTKRTSRSGLTMSVYGGRPEVIGALSNLRNCRVGPGNFTPSLSQIRT
jgi:hypothetical protein